jgi:hypothetical protein
MGKDLLKTIGLSVLLLAGCNAEKDKVIEEILPEPYFADIPVSHQDSSPDADFADIDGDGDLDYIITQKEMDSWGNYRTRSYLFKNDGKGNFTLRRNYNPIKIE